MKQVIGYLIALSERVDAVWFRNVKRFGVGLDVFVDADAVEIDLGLALWTLTIIIDK